MDKKENATRQARVFGLRDGAVTSGGQRHAQEPEKLAYRRAGIIEQ
ncbi:MAG TPA: hypothetical protein VFD70_02435 [Anaerolineae bacterium]|nr:hypothetical protein [Anaerolineae bacterium]